VRGWYELNEPEEIAKWTRYAQVELGVPEDFVSLTTVEGEGITLFRRTTGEVFDVKFGHFESLADGSLEPIAKSFDDFLLWCKLRADARS